ncbi:MAG: hypothetical protein HY076_00430 [Candidatus Eisenbacteria bacterium]|uniref:Gingipain domain-containing protein n=1 Tax=Eiseniibacteriota bacterium TaxID=2212470 RepID=A0A9D6L4Y8_UNCEI|nr:hypothetical protein [Candidatus Eisenbacteria bacterium]MBI3538726.1 hypothetical protein [Candidatus Eisenbacteria bacterium]
MLAAATIPSAGYAAAVAPPRAAAPLPVAAARSAPPRAIADAATIGSAPATFAGVSLAPAAGTGVRFSVDVPAPALVPLAHEGADLVRIAIPGYVNDGPGGAPALPERVVTVAVPPTGAVSIRVSSGTPDVRDGVRLARVPLVPRAQRGPGRGTSEDESRAEAGAQEVADGLAMRDAPAPDIGVVAAGGARARLLEVGWMRNQRVARIAIAPASYDIAARRLTVERRIDVAVDVAGGAAPSLGERPAEDPDPFETVYRATVLNYAQGRAWRRTRAAGRGQLFGATPGALRAASVVPDTSVYAGRTWIKIAFDSTGFYKVDFAELRTLLLFGNNTTVRLDSLRLFTWPGFPVMPENSYCDRCGYQEVAMGFVETNSNGIFDDNKEYLYFYALGSSDWADRYDPSLPDTVFINHPYERRNYCYLTIATDQLPVGGSPKRIATEPVPARTGTEVVPTTFAARLHYEMDSANAFWPDAWPNPAFKSNLFWEKWFWTTVYDRGAPFATIAAAPSVDTSQPSRLRARFWGVTDLPGKSFGMFDHYLNVGFNSLAFPTHRWQNMWAMTYDTTLVGLVQPSNALTLSVPLVVDPDAFAESQRVDQTALAWFDLFYARRFEPIANELEFDSSPAGGNWLYTITPFTLDVSLPPRVFDVTDPLAPIEILGGVYAGGQLQFNRVESGLRRYAVIPDDRILRVTNADVTMAPLSSQNNLRAAPTPGQDGADYLIIYYDGFQAAADSLANWRRERLPMPTPPPYRTATVPISALYDQFSGGRTDPGAIRNFLRSAFYNWAHPPVYVTLLGDASADFKDVRGLAPIGLPGCLLPSYENGYVSFLERQYATDDWMLNVNDSTVVVPDFIGGRIPADDAAGALGFVVDKLLPYERSAPLGEWRNRVLLVADDNMQGAQPDALRWEHVRQTAVLDNLMPNHLDRAYAYLHTYPDGPDHTKPGCKADILKNVNDGVVLWNFIGHGSPFKITDESVFLDSDAGTLTNATRPCAFIAASCDVGKYDDPGVQSLGERLVMSPGGGCVSVISATELAFSFENAELNQVIYNRLFLRDTVLTTPDAGRYYVTLSQALLEAKISSFGSSNNQKYQEMGDAATRLDLPRFWVDLTMKDETGAPIDTLRRGAVVSFDGRVLDQPGGVLMPFTGTAAMLIEDSAPIDTTFDCTFCSREPYPWRAAPIFRGDARVAGGVFSGKFVVPLDAVVGPRARLRGYAQGAAIPIASSTDATGSMPFTLVPGTAPAGDTEGPSIALSFAGGSTSVRPNAVLRADITDPSGILITGHTLQNGIIVTVDGNSNTRADITSTFRYAAGSYQTGTASFTLPGLAPGPHTIKVSAADNLASGINAAAHRASASIDFEVSEIPALAVKRAFLFPNPTRSGGPGSGGTFVIDAPGDAVNVLLNLYSVSGRLLRTLKAFGGLGQVQIPWDGLDRDGERLASGTYLFKAQVNAQDAAGASNPRSRAVGEGRFVILGR